MATVGLTSGASVPEVLVRGVLEHLAERGWTDVEEVTTAEETLTFSLPRELRPQRARAGCPLSGSPRWRSARPQPLGEQPEQPGGQHQRRWSRPSSGTR